MKISAVIPAYNSEQTIGRAIKSILNQTRPADEIIVVDDGSADNTVQTVQAFGDKVILIEQENAGASVARNTGITAASGDWIAFLDADDEWLPDKLKLQTEHLARNPELQWTTANFYRCQCKQNHRCLSDMSQETINLCQVHLGKTEYFEDYLNAYSLLAKGHTDTMLIHCELLKQAGLFLPGQKRMNDVDLWYRISYIQPRIGFVFEPLAVYHVDVDNSIMKVHTDWRLIDEFLKRHFKLADEAHRLEAFRPCAKIGLRYWIRVLMDNNEGLGIRRLLQQHRDLFEQQSYRHLWMASFVPRLWKWRQSRKQK